jgi:putative transcriptional regulator
MNFAQEIKNIRQHCFLSQEAFARELNVSFSSVNRWEGGRAKPNMIAMKNIKSFCAAQNVDFSKLEQAWIEFEKTQKEV